MRAGITSERKHVWAYEQNIIYRLTLKVNAFYIMQTKANSLICRRLNVNCVMAFDV